MTTYRLIGKTLAPVSKRTFLMGAAANFIH